MVGEQEVPMALEYPARPIGRGGKRKRMARRRRRRRVPKRVRRRVKRANRSRKKYSKRRMNRFRRYKKKFTSAKVMRNMMYHVLNTIAPLRFGTVTTNKRIDTLVNTATYELAALNAGWTWMIVTGKQNMIHHIPHHFS